MREINTDFAIPNITKTILDGIFDAVVFLDTEYRVQWCNVAFSQLVQQSLSDLVNRHLNQILPLKKDGQTVVPKIDLQQSNSEFIEYEYLQENCTLILQISRRFIDSNTILLTLRDITATKQLEIQYQDLLAKNQESLSLLQTTLEATADGILVIDKNRNAPVYNQKFLQMWAVPPEFMPSENERLQYLASQTVNPEEFVDKVFDLFFNYPEKTVLDYLELKDGRIFERYSQPQWRGEEIIGRVWSFRDVTQQKRAEESLRENEERLRTLINATPDIICFKDAEGRWLASNQANLEFLELKDVNYFGKTDAELASYSPTYREAFLHCHITDEKAWEWKSPYRVEEEVLRPNGETRIWDMVKVPLFTANGERKALVILGRDITERKQTETALEQSEKKYRNIFTNSQVGIGRTRIKDGLILDANQRSAEIFGYSSPLELVNKHYTTEFLVNLNDRNLLLETLAEKREVRDFESQLQQRNGSRRWILVSLRLNKEEDCIDFVITDISDRKHLEQELCQKQKQIEALLNAIPDRMFRQRLDGTYLDCKGNFDGSFFKVQDLIGKKMQDLPMLPNSLKEELLKQFKKAVDTGKLQTFEHELMQPNGKHFYETRIVKSGTDEVVCIVRDITDRKQAEKELKARETQYKDLVQTANCIILRWDARGNVRFLNDYGQRLFGFSESEIVGHNVVGTIVPKTETSGRDLETLMVDICQHPEDYLFNENENICKNGDRVWIVWANKPILNDQGHLLEILSVGTDATQRKEVEIALQKSEAKFRSIVENINDLIYLHDLEGVFSYISPNISLLLGYEVFEVEGKSFSQFVHKQDIPLCFASTRKAIEGGERVSGDEVRVRHKNGSWRWFSCNIAPIYEPNGKAFVLGIAHDITYRKQAEAALLRSEQKYRRLFENSQVGIFRTRVEDGLILDANQRYAEIAGYHHVEDLIGKHFTPEFYVNSQDRELLLDRLQQYGKLNNFEMQFRQVNGEIRWGLYSIALNLEENCLEGVITDISDRKQVEMALMEAKEAAETANRAKSTFLTNMSHELRTPLNAILGFAQLMARDSTLSGRQRESLATINRSGEHLLGLINDVLEMSKIEAGRTVLNPNSFDLYSLLKSLREMFSVRTYSKQLGLHFHLAPNLPQYIVTDENKLRQVLMNLLSNAIKFTKVGGVTLQVTAEKEDSGYKLFFAVQDTGVGIAPEEIPSLFKPFLQTHSGTQAREGTGLGLTISRQFVRLMGGDILVNSAVGEGSRFQFWISVTTAEAVSSVTPTRKVLRLADTSPSYRILVVDDRPENCALMTQLLNEVGFATRIARNGEDAIAQWQIWQPHLIWMDIRMPIMDGYEATGKIRTQGTENPPIIIALTASAFEEEKNSILAAGCDDFVHKPFREQVIFEKMAKHLGVKYLYEDDSQENENMGQNSPISLSSDAFQGMDQDWVQQLHQAALEVDADQINQLIQDIPSENIMLIQGLAELVHNFAFDDILELTKGVLP